MSKRSQAGPELAGLLLRGVIGSTMIAHGIKHGRDFDGTASWFSSIGFAKPKVQAKGSAVVEIAAGALLLAGAATPLASAAVVGTMAVAARVVHVPNGFFITREGWEYVANLATSAVVLATIGPGRLSVDRALGVDRRISGGVGAVIAAGVGIVAATAQLATYWQDPERPNYAPLDLSETRSMWHRVWPCSGASARSAGPMGFDN